MSGPYRLPDPEPPAERGLRWWGEGEYVRAVKTTVLNADRVEAFVGGDSGVHPDGGCVVAGPAGAIRYKPGDYIVCNEAGKYWVATESAFHMFYRRA